jgi:hypothetical protein
MIPDTVMFQWPEAEAARNGASTIRPDIIPCTERRASLDWVAGFASHADPTNCTTVVLTSPEQSVAKEVKAKVFFPLSPFDWLTNIVRSAGLGNRQFHPVVMSLVTDAPVVTFDQHHSDPLSRVRSKTWLLLQKFGAARYCHPSPFLRFLSLKQAWREQGEQRGAEKHRHDSAQRLIDVLARYSDTAFAAVAGPEREVRQS